MSVSSCLPGLVESGAVTKEQAERARGLFDELEASYKRQFGDQAASAMASEQTVKMLAAEAAQKRRQAVLQIGAQKNIMRNLERIRAEGGRIDRAAMAHLDFDVRVKGISNVEARRRAILGRAHAMIPEVLHTFHRDLLGRVRHAARLENMVREAFGEATGDAAAHELSKAWGQAAEWLRLKFNAAGGAIGKRADWGLPQTHDSLKVRQASFQDWRDFIAPMLDTARMVDEQTGQPFTPQSLELALRDVHETIRTDGWAKRQPGGGAGSKLANRRADSRFLVFKDADSWLKYNERFGAADPFSAMMGYVDGMARDVAALEVLGPNPATTLKWLGDIVEKEAALVGEQGLLDRAATARFQMDTMWGVYTGELNRPVNATVARGFAGFRAIQSAAKLGGAAITAVTDLGFQNVTARFNGLGFTGIVKGYARLLNPFDHADQQIAVRSGLIAEEWAQRAAAIHRYVDDVNAPEVARRLNDGVLRLSGLSAWTQAGRWAFGMEFMGGLADAAGRKFADLEPNLREALERYGIQEDGWELIRSTPAYQHKGSSFLRPDELAARTDIPAAVADSLATRVLEMIQTESRFAVPDASLRTKAITTANARPGTLLGEAARSVFQFKAFPVTILQTHFARAVFANSQMGRARYAAHLVIGTTLMGALAMELKQIASGKDPREADTGAFWAAAFLQGGGAGIFGDFLFSDQNRFGGGLMSTLAGPTLTTGSDALKLTVGNVQELLAGKDTNAGKEAVRFIGANTPGSSLWYSRLAFQRIILDEMQQMVDGDAREDFSRMEAKARKDFGQDYWWAPGESQPDRAPNIAATLGGDE